jgi:DNA repair photolyase
VDFRRASALPVTAFATRERLKSQKGAQGPGAGNAWDPSAGELDATRETLRTLIGDAPDGTAIAGWQLVHIDVDESLGYFFERRGGRIEITLSPRDDSRPRYAQTASFNLGYYVARLPGRELPEDARSLVTQVAELVAAHDDGSAALRFARKDGADAVGEARTTRVRSLLCPTTVDGVRYYTANPYIGCVIGCRFCYAQARVSIVRRFGGARDLPWGRYVLVKENAPDVLERELQSMPPLPVVFSPLVADAYQGLERRARVTRGCLEVLARRSIRAFVLTRSTLVTRDIDLFRRIPGATVGFSIPTDRDDVAFAYEPRAARVSARFESLAQLRKAGIRTVAVVQPLLAFEVERFADRLASACDAVRVDVYRPPDIGGAPLEPERPGACPPPADQEAVRADLTRALIARGVRLWTTHLPP